MLQEPAWKNDQSLLSAGAAVESGASAGGDVTTACWVQQWRTSSRTQAGNHVGDSVAGGHVGIYAGSGESIDKFDGGSIFITGLWTTFLPREWG